MVLKFSLVGTKIPAGSTIDSAKMMLYLNYQLTGNTQVQNVYKITESWNASLRWESAAALSSRDPGWIADNTTPVTFDPALVATVTNAGGSVNKWVTFNVTSAIKTFWATPSTNNGFLLRAPGTDQINSYTSSDATTIAQRPKLIVWSHGGTPTAINPTRMTVQSRMLSIKGAATGVLLSGFAGSARDVSISLFDMQGKCVLFDRADNAGTIQLIPHASGSRILLASVKVGATGETIARKVVVQ